MFLVLALVLVGVQENFFCSIHTIRCPIHIQRTKYKLFDSNIQIEFQCKVRYFPFRIIFLMFFFSICNYFILFPHFNWNSSLICYSLLQLFTAIWFLQFTCFFLPRSLSIPLMSSSLNIVCFVFHSTKNRFSAKAI